MCTAKDGIVCHATSGMLGPSLWHSLTRLLVGEYCTVCFSVITSANTVTIVVSQRSLLSICMVVCCCC